MRALVCDSWRDFDALEVRDIPPPPLRPGGVRLCVAAAGVSFATQLVVSGRYQRRPPCPSCRAPRSSAP
jgi:NADPH2:quinone reductase